MDMDISMDIHGYPRKFVDMDMDMDMDGKFHIHVRQACLNIIAQYRVWSKPMGM